MPENLRAKIKEWNKTKSITLATEICDELAKLPEPLIEDENLMRDRLEKAKDK